MNQRRFKRAGVDGRKGLLLLLLGLLLAVSSGPLLAAPLAQSTHQGPAPVARAPAKNDPIPQRVQVSTAAPLRGDPARGKDLFTGVSPFQNGGPPCMACHSIAGIGVLGGGALGPDLTLAYSKFGEEGTKSILATLPFPTMYSIYNKRPLAPEEQDHLKAFLENADVTQRSPQTVGQLVLLTAAGAVIMLALAQLLWRNRLTGVRKPLVQGERRFT